MGALADPGAPADAQPLPSGSVFTPVTPSRLLDTRTVQGLAAPSTAPVAGAQTLVVQITGTGTAPDVVSQAALAVVLNVTYVDAVGPGYVTLYPSGVARPTASHLNKVGTGPVPNSVTVKLGADGAVAISSGRSGPGGARRSPSAATASG